MPFWIIPNKWDIIQARNFKAAQRISNSILVCGPFHSERFAISRFDKIMEHFCRDKEVYDMWRRAKCD